VTLFQKGVLRTGFSEVPQSFWPDGGNSAWFWSLCYRSVAISPALSKALARTGPTVKMMLLYIKETSIDTLQHTVSIVVEVVFDSYKKDAGGAAVISCLMFPF